MKRLSRVVCAVLVAGALLVVVNPTSQAGRTGGRLNTVVNVPSAQSVFFDISFDAGPASVSIRTNGQTLMQVKLYDSDGHIAEGVGPFNFKTATMNVYRQGMFRVEVVNAGLVANSATVTSN
jgi:hypothetical protein